MNNPTKPASKAQAVGFAYPMVGTSLDGSWKAGPAARLFRGFGRLVAVTVALWLAPVVAAPSPDVERLAAIEKSAFKVDQAATKLADVAEAVRADGRIHSLTIVEDRADDLERRIAALHTLVDDMRRVTPISTDGASPPRR